MQDTAVAHLYHLFCRRERRKMQLSENLLQSDQFHSNMFIGTSISDTGGKMAKYQQNVKFHMISRLRLIVSL